MDRKRKYILQCVVLFFPRSRPHKWLGKAECRQHNERRRRERCVIGYLLFHVAFKNRWTKDVQGKRKMRGSRYDRCTGKHGVEAEMEALGQLTVIREVNKQGLACGLSVIYSRGYEQWALVQIALMREVVNPGCWMRNTGAGTAGNRSSPCVQMHKCP